MTGIQTLIDFAEQHRSLLDSEKERIVSLKKQLENLLASSEKATAAAASSILPVHPSQTIPATSKPISNHSKNVTTSLKVQDVVSKTAATSDLVPNNLPAISEDRLFATGFPPLSNSFEPEQRRIAALKYKEDLIKQIQEKRERDELDRKAQDTEDKRLEQRITQQRNKMLNEYKQEEERLRKKTADLIKKQEIVRSSQGLHTPIKSRALNHIPPRSPSYLHVKGRNSRLGNARQMLLSDRLSNIKIAPMPESSSTPPKQTHESLPPSAEPERPSNPIPPTTQDSTRESSGPSTQPSYGKKLTIKCKSVVFIMS